MKPKISMITLGVGNLERSIQFYRDGLGFAPHNYKSGDDMVMFVLEGSWLGLYPRAALAEDAQVEGEGSGFAGYHWRTTSSRGPRSTRCSPSPWRPAPRR